MLSIQHVTKLFYGFKAVDDFSLEVGDGELVGLIGPNGAGKTTVLNLICGGYYPDDGGIFLDDERIDRLRASEIARRGVARTFQVTRVFRRLTVLENMIAPAIACAPHQQREHTANALRLLDLVDLTHLKDEFAGDLSGGQQRLLELARALMISQKLTLLDEPSVGLHPVLRAKLLHAIMSSKTSAFLIVSHDIPFVLGLCQHIVVMSAGSKIAEGTSEQIRENEQVIEAYLGR